MSTKITRNVVLLVGSAVIFLSIGLSTSSIAFIQHANAQANSNMTGSSLIGGSNSQNQTMGSNMIIGYPGGPNITGSIPIVSTISKATASQIHISLPNATATAEKSVGTNAHAIIAHLGIVNGFLVYTILLTDTNSNFHYVTVDVGNGKVLSSNQLSMMAMMRGGAMIMAMGPAMMMVPGMGVMIGPVMMMGPVMMNEPQSYGNSFP
jgi:hypothetical protein